jgi:hypothetical protein
MRREDVQTGLLVRVVANYSNVPAGTCATVDSIGTMGDGAWFFTVRWHNYKPIQSKCPKGVTDYSLNLWEADLALFGVVSEEEQTGKRANEEVSPSWSLPSLPQLGGWKARRRRVHPNQLSLFSADDF